MGGFTGKPSVTPGHDSAIDGEYNTSYPATLLRSEEQNCLCNICGLTIATQGMECVERWENLRDVFLAKKCRIHWSLYNSRRDGVDSDSISRQFKSEIAHQCMHTGIGPDCRRGLEQTT